MLLIHSVFAAESVVVWLSPVPFRSLGHPLRFRGHLRRDASSCDLGRLAAWRGGPRGAARGSTDPELQGRFCGDSRGWRSDDLGTCFLDLLDVWSFLKVFFFGNAWENTLNSRLSPWGSYSGMPKLPGGHIEIPRHAMAATAAMCSINCTECNKSKHRAVRLPL